MYWVADKTKLGSLATTGLIFLWILSSLALPSHGKERLRLATTTSTANSGLLDVLLPPFEKRFNIRVDVIPVGTGQALKLGERGEVDVVLVHARSLEDRFVEAGFGVNRRDVMYNDFVIAGHPHDPAGIKGSHSVVDAFINIAAKGAPFISRGDNSGTHIKELSIWKQAGLAPEGLWYMEVGRGMGESLIMASEKGAYILSDRATFLALREKLRLGILFEGDPALFNPYGIIAVNPARYTHVNYTMAVALIDWMTSPEGQRIIYRFGIERFGEPLFVPLVVPKP